jgi:hypothetical protein
VIPPPLVQICEDDQPAHKESRAICLTRTLARAGCQRAQGPGASTATSYPWPARTCQRFATPKRGNKSVRVTEPLAHPSDGGCVRARASLGLQTPAGGAHSGTEGPWPSVWPGTQPALTRRPARRRGRWRSSGTVVGIAVLILAISSPRQRIGPVTGLGCLRHERHVISPAGPVPFPRAERVTQHPT